jgi:hypothetical protein
MQLDQVQSQLDALASTWVIVVCNTQ